MAVSQVLRDEWSAVIQEMLAGIEKELLAHPDVEKRKAELEAEYNSEHKHTLALIFEIEVLNDQIDNLSERRNKLNTELSGSDHLDQHLFRSDSGRTVFEARRHQAIVQNLTDAVADHPKLAERYARYREVKDNLRLTLLLANTPTKLKEAMVRLCKSLGIDLPTV